MPVRFADSNLNWMSDMHEQEAGARQLVGAGVAITLPTMSERLRDEKVRLEKRLSEVNEAISAMEANPEVARTVDAIIKLGGFYLP